MFETTSKILGNINNLFKVNNKINGTTSVRIGLVPLFFNMINIQLQSLLLTLNMHLAGERVVQHVRLH